MDNLGDTILTIARSLFDDLEAVNAYRAQFHLQLPYDLGGAEEKAAVYTAFNTFSELWMEILHGAKMQLNAAVAAADCQPEGELKPFLEDCLEQIDITNADTRASYDYIEAILVELNCSGFG